MSERMGGAVVRGGDGRGGEEGRAHVVLDLALVRFAVVVDGRTGKAHIVIKDKSVGAFAK